MLFNCFTSNSLTTPIHLQNLTLPCSLEVTHKMIPKSTEDIMGGAPAQWLEQGRMRCNSGRKEGSAVRGSVRERGKKNYGSIWCVARQTKTHALCMLLHCSVVFEAPYMDGGNESPFLFSGEPMRQGWQLILVKLYLGLLCQKVLLNVSETALWPTSFRTPSFGASWRWGFEASSVCLAKNKPFKCQIQKWTAWFPWVIDGFMACPVKSSLFKKTEHNYFPTLSPPTFTIDRWAYRLLLCKSWHFGKNSIVHEHKNNQTTPLINSTC